MTLHVHRQPRGSGLTRRAHLKQLEPDRWKALKRESTVALVQRIAEDSDELALRVLLETRTLFRLKDEPPLLLHQFLLKLRDRSARAERYSINEVDLADCAYDMTLSKYYNLPNAPESESNPDDSFVRGGKVDCRNYYRAFLRTMQWKMAQGHFSTHADEELQAARLLQKKVYKSFAWSKLECRRRSPFSIRYTWEVDGTRLYLYYPSYMTAKKFRAWLEENTKGIDLTSPNAQAQVQSLIDANLAKGYHVPLDQSGVYGVLGGEQELCSIEFQEGVMFVKSLAVAVAAEKARNIDQLRPAIRRLGKETLRHLILQIYSDVADDEYSVSRMARRYGLSKSTLSRFAGNTWPRESEEGGASSVPDLWQNTAETLAGNPAFMETVMSSGVAGGLGKVLQLMEHPGGQKDGK